MSLRVAFVCTGNRFRSPLAAAVFGSEVATDVESFGTLDVAGTPALPEAVDFGRELGLDLSAHRARVIERGSLAGFDLVVGFERSHLATAVVDGGAERDVTFTLPELVELLANVDEADPRAALAAAATSRTVGKTFAGVPELPDPLGRPRREQRELAVRVVELTRRLARSLAGA